MFKIPNCFCLVENNSKSFPLCITVTIVLLKYLKKQTATLVNQRLRLMNSWDFRYGYACGGSGGEGCGEGGGGGGWGGCV